MSLFRRRKLDPTPAVKVESRFDIIRDAVQAHADRGEDAGPIYRAMLEWQPSERDIIRAAVHVVYGCACPQSIAGTGPHFDGGLI